MSSLTRKISLPLLVVFLGTAIGALSGQFVWTLLAAVGGWVLLVIVRNLCGFHRVSDSGKRGVPTGTDGLMVNESGQCKSRLQKWNDEVLYSPAYKGTPGNIWNEPISASDD